MAAFDESSRCRGYVGSGARDTEARIDAVKSDAKAPALAAYPWPQVAASCQHHQGYVLGASPAANRHFASRQGHERLLVQLRFVRAITEFGSAREKVARWTSPKTFRP